MSEHLSTSAAIANRLRTARERAGLSQGQVAKMLGLHRPSVTEMEAGRRKVSAEELAELAEIYGVDIKWLVYGETWRTNDMTRLELAARELAEISPDDLEKLYELLTTLKQPKS